MQGPLIIDLDGQQLTNEEKDLLLDPLVGGVIFFTRNFANHEQLKGLVDNIRSVRQELLICVDQEGGRVQRFKEGFTRLPALGELAALSLSTTVDLHKIVRMHACVMASELRSAGLDFSFTPVVDINFGHNTVIGDRAFGSDPQQVADLAVSYTRELRRIGMAAVAKHFPGHGYVAEDTHIHVAEDLRSKQQILDVDILPFKALINEGVAGIMPAHVLYPEVDTNPAVQSRRWIEEILRGELGFEGAVISDDLGMAGTAGGATIAEKVKKAIMAGCDLLMLCNDRRGLKCALHALHEMQVDHLSARHCARRKRLSWQAGTISPTDFSLEYARQIFQGSG